MSVASAASRISTLSKPTVSAQRKQKDVGGGSPDGKSRLSASALATIPQGPSAIDSMTVDACIEFVSAPHHTWDSASREMARMATKAQLTQAALESRGGGRAGTICDDTASVRSGVSSISAFSFAKTNASSVRKGPSKGHMAMLPLGGANGSAIAPSREVPDMVLSGSSANCAGGFAFVGQQPHGSVATSAGIGPRKPSPPPGNGTDAEDRGDFAALQRVGSFAGSAGGISGIRGARGNQAPFSAPTQGRRPNDTLSFSSSQGVRPAGTVKKVVAPPSQQRKTVLPASPDLGDLLMVGGVGAKKLGQPNAK